MKGATPDPLDSTSNPPRQNITTNTGTSQYFFRTRRKAKNSRRKDMGNPGNGFLLKSSELLAHRFRWGPTLRTPQPIARRAPVELETQWILPRCAHQKPYRHDGTVEQYGHDDRIHDPGQQNPKLQPRGIGRR